MFCFDFWISNQSLNILKKNMTLIAYVLTKWRTPKDVDKQISKKSCFRRPYDKQHGKRSRTLLKYPREPSYHFFWSIWKRLSWKNSLLVICKILEHFVKLFNADDNYCRLITDNLMQSIKMKLSKEKKSFSDLFSQFSSLRLNFEHFEKKDDFHSLCFYETTDSEMRG